MLASGLWKCLPPGFSKKFKKKKTGGQSFVLSFPLPEVYVPQTAFIIWWESRFLKNDSGTYVKVFNFYKKQNIL